MRVKICGLTNADDAELAVALGADALGFNLFEGSPRCIDLDREAHWISALPRHVVKVAVLVNAPLEDALLVAAHPAIDMLQLHGDESPGYCTELARRGLPFIRALRLRSPDDIISATGYSTDQVLIDAYHDRAYGGTGRRLDMKLAGAFVRAHPGLHVLLAGGLTAENVAEAVREVKPYGVDVASGVESEPGRKDQGKLRAFMEALR